MSETKYELWQHPNGRWYVRWYAKGGSERLSTRTRDEREAERFLKQFKAGTLAKKPPSKILVSDILDGYLADRKGKVRAWGTLAFAAKGLKPHLGDLHAHQLNDGVMDAYVAARERSAGTIMREVVTLRAALKWAHRKGWIHALPELPMPVSAPPPRDRWITKEEAARLLDACREPHLRLFVLLALRTAARTGAIMDLTWDQVDMKSRLIDYGPGHGNKRRAIVPIDDRLYEALAEAKGLACSERVIEFNGQPVKSIRTAFRKAVKRAGLERVGRHTLRHSAATWAVMSGAPLSKVARLLGDSEKMVEKVYGKHSPGWLREAVDALDF
jgi:integrase